MRQPLGLLLDELDITHTEGQVDRLERYRQWLIQEAIPAGGLGPSEGDRIFDRHLADSLMYLRGFPRAARTIIDIGSGVGLPGIPVAISRPESRVVILDRSERRTWLARRAVRILDLENVTVVTQDANDVMVPGGPATFDVALFRASLPIAPAAAVLVSLLEADGVGLLGVSRLPDEPDIPDAPPGVHFNLTAEVSSVLDSPFWLLRMRIV